MREKQSRDAWEGMVLKAAEDYRSGMGLIDQLGAFGLLDPAMVGMLIAIRRGLFEETNASSARELVLIDMAVVAYANAMRLQSMIGNTALIIESEMFGQPTLRAKWMNEYGGRPEDIQGLAVEEHVARLRDQLLPLVERAHRTVRESIEAIGHMGRCLRCGSSEPRRSTSSCWRRDRQDEGPGPVGPGGRG